MVHCSLKSLIFFGMSQGPLDGTELMNKMLQDIEKIYTKLKILDEVKEKQDKMEI